jgi:hypothetical protein
MNLNPVDEAIERYVRERMAKGKKEAGTRFLSYAHLRYSGSELAEFLKKTSGISRYYIDYLRVMVNPLKGPELAFFATVTTMGAYGAYLMTDVDLRTLGIVILSGALVNCWTIVKNVLRKWCDLDVMIAIYRELVQLAEQELGTSQTIPT